MRRWRLLGIGRDHHDPREVQFHPQEVGEGGKDRFGLADALNGLGKLQQPIDGSRALSEMLFRSLVLGE